MTLAELRELMNTPGPVGPSSPIVVAALIALPALLDAVEAAERLRSHVALWWGEHPDVAAFDAAVARLNSD